MKVVINTCFGGFGLSHKAVMMISELKGWNLEIKESGKLKMFKPFVYKKDGEIFDPVEFFDSDNSRTDEDLVKTVEALGKGSNCITSELKVVEIPDEILWHIEEYDGNEHISERHRTWH